MKSVTLPAANCLELEDRSTQGFYGEKKQADAMD
jgi:hypothetical protein